MQPSAQGRLRAADVCDVEFTAEHLGNDRRLRTAGRAAIAFPAELLGDDRRPLRSLNDPVNY